MAPYTWMMKTDSSILFISSTEVSVKVFLKLS